MQHLLHSREVRHSIYRAATVVCSLPFNVHNVYIFTNIFLFTYILNHCFHGVFLCVCLFLAQLNAKFGVSVPLWRSQTSFVRLFILLQKQQGKFMKMKPRRVPLLECPFVFFSPEVFIGAEIVFIDGKGVQNELQRYEREGIQDGSRDPDR